MNVAAYTSPTGAIRAAAFDKLFLTVMTGSAVPDADFDEFLRWSQQFKARVSLSWIRETSLTATQRNRASAVVKSRGVAERAAILTDSKLVLGIVTAFSWFVNVDYRAFRPDQIEPALAWLHEGHPFDVTRAQLVLRELLESTKPPAR